MRDLGKLVLTNVPFPSKPHQEHGLKLDFLKLGIAILNLGVFEFIDIIITKQKNV